MKKKNIFAIVLAMALVAVVSVGATLAYLTAETKDVKNTFKFADGMEVTLTEPSPTPKVQETIEPNDDGGFDYTNIVPGQDLEKCPTLTAKTPVDSYVFVEVTGSSELAKIKEITDGDDTLADWILYKSYDTAPNDFHNGIYYKIVNAKVDADGNAVEQPLGTVFNTVVTSKDADGTIDPSAIMVKAFEIQKNGDAAFDVDTAAAEAMSYFAGTTGGTTGGTGSDPVVEPETPVEGA